jgi:hypothetical protein
LAAISKKTTLLATSIKPLKAKFTINGICAKPNALSTYDKPGRPLKSSSESSLMMVAAALIPAKALNFTLGESTNVSWGKTFQEILLTLRPSAFTILHSATPSTFSLK